MTKCHIICSTSLYEFNHHIPFFSRLCHTMYQSMMGDILHCHSGDRQSVLVVQVSLLWLQSQWAGSMALTELQHLCMQPSHVLVKLEGGSEGEL